MAIHRRAARDALSTLTEEAAARLREPVKVEGLSRGSEADRIDKRLSQITGEVLAGKHYDCPWELFRVQHFPGWEHEEVAAALGAWSRRKGIKVTFEGRTVRELPLIFVCIRT